MTADAARVEEQETSPTVLAGLVEPGRPAFEADEADEDVLLDGYLPL